MAGRGPAPKKPEERRRRNVPMAGEWRELPSDPYDGPRPPMPDLDTLEAAWTWAQWWSSPMAHMWTEADWPGLIRLILMIDSSQSLEALKEIRMQEERFGLSPKGRQGLRWRITESEDGKKAPKSSSSDMKKRLRVVGDS